MDTVFKLFPKQIEIPKKKHLPDPVFIKSSRSGTANMNWQYLDYGIKGVSSIARQVIDFCPIIDPDEEVQFNYFERGAEFVTHIDDGCRYAAIVGVDGSHKVVFAYHPELTGLGKVLSWEQVYDHQLVTDVVKLTKGDLLIIDMEVSRKEKVGHGVPKCKNRSISVVMRD